MVRKGIVLLLALALALCACATTENPAGAHLAYSSDGVPIAYDLEGSGPVALVFVHGWSCDRTYWRHQVGPFSSDYQVAVIDLAGHGTSGLGRTDYTVNSFAHDVEAVVAGLDAEQVILVGHSMGGAVIAEAARLLPDRVIGLIGIDTLQDVSNSIDPEQLDSIVRPFEDDFVPRMREFVSAMFVPGTPEPLVQWVQDDMAAAPQAVALSAFREYLGLYTTDEGARVFQTIQAPVHCLNSTLWPTATDSNRELMNSFDVTLMEDVGHFLMLEKPQQFNDELRVIVEKVLDPP